MRIRANRKNLRKHARALLGNNYTPDRAVELRRECEFGFVRGPGHISHSEAAHIGRIDKILGNHGAEGMILGEDGEDVSGSCCASLIAHDIQYSNTGDTYALTVLYYNHRLFIGDWGSIVESIGN